MGVNASCLRDGLFCSSGTDGSQPVVEDAWLPLEGEDGVAGGDGSIDIAESHKAETYPPAGDEVEIEDDGGDDPNTVGAVDGSPVRKNSSNSGGTPTAGTRRQSTLEEEVAMYSAPRGSITAGADSPAVASTAGAKSPSGELNGEHQGERTDAPRKSLPRHSLSSTGKLWVGTTSRPLQPDEDPRKDRQGKLKNTWSVSEGTNFSVRIGPNYAKNGQKAASLSSLYEVIAVDLIKGDDIIHHVAKNVNWTSIDINLSQELRRGKAGPLPLVIICNSQIPDYSPLNANFKKDAGVSLVTYYRIRPETAAWYVPVNGSTPPSPEKRPPCLGLFEQFLTKGKSEKPCPLKCIGKVEYLEDADLAQVTLDVLSKYNGKPALLTKSATIHRGMAPGGYRYLEVDYDIRKWSILARTSLAKFRDEASSLTLSLGHLVEGTLDTELPERMLCSVCLHQFDFNTLNVPFFPGVGGKPK